MTLIELWQTHPHWQRVLLCNLATGYLWGSRVSQTQAEPPKLNVRLRRLGLPSHYGTAALPRVYRVGATINSKFFQRFLDISNYPPDF